MRSGLGEQMPLTLVLGINTGTSGYLNLFHRLTEDTGLHADKISVSVTIQQVQEQCRSVLQPFQKVSRTPDVQAQGAKRQIVMEPLLMSHFSCVEAY